jgi:hypothetical protein
VRRIGVLMSADENDPVAKTYVFAFTQALAGLGWSDGRDVRIDLRWGRGDINRTRALAQEKAGALSSQSKNRALHCSEQREQCCSRLRTVVTR